MNQTEFDRLPGIIERKEMLAGSGYWKTELDAMRKAWLLSRDPKKNDLSQENIRRLLDAGMMPVWMNPVKPGKMISQKGTKGTKTKKEKGYRKAKYYKVALAVIAGFRM